MFPGFVFDIGYEEPDHDLGEDENATTFRLTKGDDEMFVHLYNMHNGYYSHGFEVKDGDKVLRDGSL